MYADNTLVVALRDLTLSTMPGYPEALQCHLVLTIFNYDPYSRDFAFLGDFDSVVRQIECISQTRNMRYPDFEDNLIKNDKPVLAPLDQQEMQITHNISECMPFIEYVAPLLTGKGTDITCNPKFNLRDKPSATISERTIRFAAPSNYLHSISQAEAFQRFDLRYEMTENNIEYQALLDSIVSRTSSELYAELLSRLQQSYSLTQVGMDSLFEFVKIFYSYCSFQWLSTQKEVMLEGLSSSDVKVDFIINPFYKGMPETFTTVGKLYAWLQTHGYADVLESAKTAIELQTRSNRGLQNIYNFSIRNSRDLVINGITASYSTKLATVPVVGYRIPTLQYMGRNDWYININLQTSNFFFIRAFRSLMEIAARSRILRNKTQKMYFIAESNAAEFSPELSENTVDPSNGLTAFLGIRNVLFDNCTYETIKDKPGWWNVNITMVQADLPLLSYESLLPMNQYDAGVLQDIDLNLKKMTQKFRRNQEDPATFRYKYFYPAITSFVKGYLKYVLGDIDSAESLISDLGDGNLLDKVLAMNNMSQKRFTSFLYGVLKTKGVIDKNVVYNEGKDSITTPVGTFTRNKLGIFGRSSTRQDLSFAQDVIRSIQPVTGFAPVPSNIQKSVDIISRMSGDIRLLHTGLGVNVENAFAMMFSKCLRDLSVKYVSIAPTECLKFLKSCGSSWREENLRPQHMLPSSVNQNQEAMQLYSNHPDLSLPYSANNFLTVPADFFFQKNIIQYDSEQINEKFKSIETMMNNIWKSELIEGACMVANPEYAKLISDYPLTATGSDYANWIKYKWMQFPDPRSSTGAKTSGVVLKDAADRIKLFKHVKGNVYIKSEPNVDFLKEKVPAVYNLWYKNIQHLSFERKMEMCSNLSEFAKRQAVIMQAMIVAGGYLNLVESRKNHMETNSTKAMGLSLDKLTQITTEKFNQIWAASYETDNSLLGSVTPWSLAVIDDVKHRIKESYTNYCARDNTLTMERAFPTFKLFFIEEDAHEWGAFDDYYMYNAVSSVDVIDSSKSAGAVASIVLSNMSGNLSDPYSVYARETQFAKDNAGTIQSVEQTQQEQILATLFLREGVTIMIKAGYSSNVDDLDTIFMGKVVSVSPGEQVNIVAHGFGAELLEVVNKGIEQKLGCSSPARSQGDVVLWAGGTLTGLEHFGLPNVFEKLGLRGSPHGDILLSPQKWRNADIYKDIFHPVFDLYFKFGVFDPRYENIYLPYTKMSLGFWGRFVNALVPYEKNLTKVATRVAMAIAIVAFCILVPGVGVGVITSIYGLSFAAGFTTTTLALTSLNAWVYGVAILGSYLGIGAIDALAGGNYGELGAITYDWLIEKNKTMFDLLQEICLYWEDYIVTVLPYNQNLPGQMRQTIYVGPRNGLYKYTDVFDSSTDFSDFIKRLQHGKSADPRLDDNETLQEAYDKKSELENDVVAARTDLLEVEKDTSISNYDEQVSKARKDVVDKERLYQLKEQKLAGYDYKTADEQQYNINNALVMLAINNPGDMYTTSSYTDAKGKPQTSVTKQVGYMPVVNYHSLTSFNHIIENNIRATSEELYNHVILQYSEDPGDTMKYTKEFFADDNIRGGNLRTYTTEATNVDPMSFPITPADVDVWMETHLRLGAKPTLPRGYMVGYNVLARMMRPMYRGEIKVIGMPQIHPFDVCLLEDYANEMIGPFEVETIHHHFDQDGFTTAITPNAIVAYQHPGKTLELYIQNSFSLPYVGKLRSFGTVRAAAGGAAATVATLGVGAMKLASSAAATIGMSSAWLAVPVGLAASFFTAKAAAGIWCWGLGKAMGRDIIHVSGLWYKNQPYVAGLEGAYKDDITVHMLDNISRLADYSREIGNIMNNIGGE